MDNTRLYLGIRPEKSTEDNESFHRRLRAFLKCALRSFGIRCTTIMVSKPSGEECNTVLQNPGEECSRLLQTSGADARCKVALQPTGVEGGVE